MPAAISPAGTTRPPPMGSPGGDDPATSGWSDPVMAWIILLAAGLFEIGWAVGLKYTEGFSRLVPTLLTAGSMVVSLGLLGLALKSLPLGTAYAVWTGVGTIGTAILGIALFDEQANLARLVCIAMIAAGIIGLKIVTPH